MQQQVLTELEELLGLFGQVLGVRPVDDLAELVKSERIYLEILGKLLPQYEDFYRELQEDQQSSFEEKLAAIVNFIESEVIEQELDVDTAKIAQGDYAQAVQLLDILYELLEGLMEDQRQRQKQQEQKAKKKEKKEKPKQLPKELQKESERPKPPPLKESEKAPEPSNKKGKDLRLEVPSSRDSSAYKLDSMYRHKDSAQGMKQKQNISGKNNQKKESKSRPISEKPAGKSSKGIPMGPDIPQSEEFTEDIVQQITKAREAAASKQRVGYNFADPQSDEALTRAKNVYKRYLEEKLKPHHQKKKLASPDLIRKNLKHSLQKIQRQGQHLNDQLKDEQLRCFIELRNEKLRYVERIHNLVLQLEKEKLLDEQNQQRKAHEQQLRIAKAKMQSLESVYNNNLEMLKEAAEKTRGEQNRTRIDQKSVMVELEKQLKHDRHRQMQGMFGAWQKEKYRLRGLFRQNTQLQQKLVQLYKRS